MADSGHSDGVQERIVSVGSDGTPAAFSSSTTSKCLVQAGCFGPLPDKRPHLYGDTGDPDKPFSPLGCFSICISLGMKIAAVNGQHCACSNQVTTVFARAESNDLCDIECRGEFTSPICGGVNDFWNLYMCYTYQQILSLAVDPWRNIAFKTVSINWAKEDGIPYSKVSVLESNYLFASDVSTDRPLVQYHMLQTDGGGVDPNVPVIYSGLSFDFDSSRLVGIAVPGSTKSGISFRYKLLVISIDTSNATRPRLTANLTTMYADVVSRADMFTDSDSTSFLMGSIVSGIVALNGIDSYVWSFGYGGAGNNPATVKSRLIFVDLSDSLRGHVFFTASLDCVVTQLAVNPFYGDVAFLAPRQGAVQFIAVATIYRDPVTSILSVNSLWDPSGLNPVYVAPISDTQGLNLLAGVSASIPMQNQSCQGIMLYDSVNGASYTDDRQLILNQPSSSNSQKKTGAIPSVLCFDIRREGVFDLWAAAGRSAENGTVSKAVAMYLYESDPGFPFSLSRPRMQSCQMSITGVSVTVTFDSVTLMGASPGGEGDSTAPGIPSYVNYSSQILSPVPASMCFSNLSLPLLLGATCYFTQSNTLFLSLDRSLSTLTFNNSLCIKPNFLYRNQGEAWSSYATGCCSVSVPSSVPPPKPVLVATPSLTLDVCSAVTLDLSDSVFCGKGCSFFWTLDKVVDSSLELGTGAPPLNSPGVLAQFTTRINTFLKEINSLSNQSSSISVPSSLFAKSAFHYFSVKLVSSWMQLSVFNFRIEKLSFQAPTVSILGSTLFVETQMTGYSITATGRISSCVNSSALLAPPALIYQWSFSNCSVNLALLPRIVSNQNIIYIPAGTHNCPAGTAWIDSASNKVACELCVVSVSVSSVDAPSIRTTQTVGVQIVKSPIVARCFNPDAAMLPVGPVFFIDCSNSLDMDAPPVASSSSYSSFQGNFAFSCWSAAGQGSSCFAPTNPVLTNIPNCVLDYSQAMVVGPGGQLYPQVLFNVTQGYCRVSRGVVALNTNLLSAGTFNFKIDVTHFDGLRTSSKNISVELVALPLPPISMNISGAPTSASEYPVGSTLQISATTSLSLSFVKNVSYSWTLLTQELNVLYNPSSATTGGGVAQYVYNPVTTLDNCKEQGIAFWTSSSPTLTILPNCLSSATAYSIRLNMQWSQTVNGGNLVPLSTYAQLMFNTASGPPSGGSFSVSSSDPAFSRTTCEIPKVLTADLWVSEDTPLSYQFGYIVDQSVTGVNASNVNSLVKYWFSDSPQPVRSFKGLLPCGQAAFGFYVTAFVRITSAAGEYTFAFAKVFSSPPSDIVSVSLSLISYGSILIPSNSAEGFANYMTAMSLLIPSNGSTVPAFVSAVASALKSVQCSTPECGDRLLVFLNTLISSVGLSPQLQEVYIFFVEQNIGRITLSTSNPSSIAQTQTLFNSISSLSLNLANSGSVAQPVTNSLVSPKSVPHITSAIRSSRTGPLAGFPQTRNLEQSDLRDHHILPRSSAEVITDCAEVYCHLSGVTCVREERFGQHNLLICCDSVNEHTNCLDPPCWFYGGETGCPKPLYAFEKNKNYSELSMIHNAEMGPLSDSRILAGQADRFTVEKDLSTRQLSEYISTLQPNLQTVFWTQHNLTTRQLASTSNQSALNASLLVSRMMAATDRIARNLIKALIKDQPPVVFDTDSFRIYIGKTTNMSSQLPSLRFPESFTVPPSSPDNPTPDNPVTGFSYYYIEYYSNIFSWALNSPISSQATVVTLSVMKANPDIPLVISPREEPIRIFADQDLFASAICRIWDPLSAFTGGGWTGEGTVNDANGCLANKWASFGVFLQSQVSSPNVSVGSNYGTTVSVNSIGVKRFFLSSLFVYLILMVGIAALIAYRIDITTQNPPQSIYLDGDGLTGPQTLSDPIAYDQRESGVSRFLWMTFKNVAVRNHIFAWPGWYHPIYTRPRRVLSGSVLITSCMTFASAIYTPRTSWLSKDIAAVGFLVAFISYPLFLIFDSMFAHQPDASKSVPVKRIQGNQVNNITAGFSRVNEPSRPVETHPSPHSFDLTFGNDLWAALQAANDAPPPPPPEENASGFVHRVQKVYEGKSSLEHQKIYETQMQSDRIRPAWVESVCSLIALSAWAGWTILAGVVVCLRSMYYDKTILEPAWCVSVGIAIVVTTTALEPLRCCVITMLAVYNYEQRRRSAGSPGMRRKIPSPKQHRPPSSSVSPVSARSQAPSRELSISRDPDPVISSHLKPRSPIFLPIQQSQRELPSRQASRSPAISPIRTPIIPIPNPAPISQPSSSRTGPLLPGRIESVIDQDSDTPRPPPR